MGLRRWPRAATVEPSHFPVGQPINLCVNRGNGGGRDEANLEAITALARNWDREWPAKLARMPPKHTDTKE
jgi:hypothetical protein